MSAPIMSRFDLFFILVDECNEVHVCQLGLCSLFTRPLFYRLQIMPLLVVLLIFTVEKKNQLIVYILWLVIVNRNVLAN